MVDGWTLVILGTLMLTGFVAHEIGRRAHVPRVTLLLLLGAVAGQAALDLVPVDVRRWFPTVTALAMSIVGFELGEHFGGGTLRRSGRIVAWVTVAQTIGTALATLVAVTLLGAPLPFALILAGIATTTAPAATLDVVREARAKGPVTETVVEVVAVDDGVGIVMFAVLVAAASVLTGAEAPTVELVGAARELGGAVLLGVLLGVPMAWLTGRIRKGELTLLETLGFVFLCGGLATLLHVSYLLACMTLGATVANRARHHKRPFHAIEGVTQPFLVAFFVLAGLQLEWRELQSIGLLGIAYVIGRTVGKVGGGLIGARLGNAPASVRRYAGWCLLPQAGVALGLSLIAAERFPDLGPQILSLLVGATVVFELVGPIATRLALGRAGETRVADESSSKSH